MNFVYITLGILIIIPIAQWLMLVIKLYGTRLTRVQIKPLTEFKLPKANQYQFNLAKQQLESLGFELFHYNAYRDLIESSRKPIIQMVMRNDEHLCYAVISNPHNPDLNRPYAIKFQSFSDKLTIEAMDADAGGIVKSFEQLHTYNYKATAINEAFEQFQAKCNELIADKSSIYYTQNAEHYCQHMQQCYDQYLRYLYQHGLVKKNKGALQLRFKQAIKLAWQLMTGNKKAAVIKPNEAEQLIKQYPFLPTVQAQSHRRVQTNQRASQLGRWGKTLLFFSSALMFALLFGIAWSPYLVLILIPVLLFHELGHYFAMKFFGYRDLQILFLPIGAMVAGNKNQPTALQKTIVSLAGPVPGLLLALVLAVWAPEFIANEYGLSLIFMLVIINYLNLLPFMPLDGGHVVNLLLFDRWPLMQFVLMLISVLIFALGAWAWSDPILTVLAVVFGLGLRSHYQQAKHVTEARKRWGEKLINRDNLTEVYHLMKDSPDPFTSKYQMATPINERLSHRSPSLRDSILGMMMYLLALLGPLLMIEKTIGFDLIGLLFNSTESSFQYDPDEAQQWNPEYWLQQYQQAESTSEKRDVLNDALAFSDESEAYYRLSLLTPHAIELYETNQWQNEPEYPQWIKYRMMSQIYENPEYQIKKDLNQLAELFGPDSLAFAKTLLEVASWQSTPETQQQLLNSLDLFESNQEYETLLDALVVLRTTYEQEQLGAYEKLLTDYLSLFKNKSPSDYSTLRTIYYGVLFESEKYPELLQMAEEESSINSDSYEFELFAWTALLDNQYQKAKFYNQQKVQAVQQQQTALKEEVGLLAGMILQDQDLFSPELNDPLFNLALAVQMNDKKAIAEELKNYQILVEGWQNTAFKDYLESISHLKQQEATALYAKKYQFLFEAVQLIEPGLLNNNAN